MSKELLRHLPKVDELLQNERLLSVTKKLNQEYLVQIIREEIECVRASILAETFPANHIDREAIIGNIEKRIQKEFDFGLKKSHQRLRRRIAYEFRQSTDAGGSQIRAR